MIYKAFFFLLYNINQLCFNDKLQLILNVLFNKFVLAVIKNILVYTPEHSTKDLSCLYEDNYASQQDIK